LDIFDVDRDKIMIYNTFLFETKKSLFNNLTK